MTRARETLVTIRAEDGRNAVLTDIASVDGVVEALPTVRPAHRPELDRRYVKLTPADVDLGYAGRRPVNHPIHADISAVRVGDEIRIADQQLLDRNGRILGRLAKRCDLPNRPLSGRIYAVMVRTRAQTQRDYLAGIKVEQ
jgi:ATP-dependent DNA helicase RecQ